MNEVQCIDDNLILPKEDLVKIHLYIKLTQDNKSNKFSDRELRIISRLYMNGGVNSNKEFKDFSDGCFEKNLCKSGAYNSIRNVFTKGRECGLLKRKSSNNWKLHENYILETKSDILVLKYFLSNYGNNQ